MCGGVERRPVTELGLQGALPEFGVGYLLGAALFTSVISVLGLLGVFEIVGRHPMSVMLAPFLWMIVHAVLEELVFRGLIFRLAERSLGSIVALLISAAVFGASHLFNPGANLLSGPCHLHRGWHLAWRDVHAHQAPVVLHRRPCGVELRAGWHFFCAGVWQRYSWAAARDACRVRFG